MAESMDENWKYKIGKEDAERFIITGTYKSEITAAGNLGGKTKREKSGGNWPHVTIVLGRVTIKDDDGNELKTYQQVYRNREYHAEHYFLKALEENVKTLLSNNKVTKFSIQAKLVQNYSPCGDCAQKIINFRNEQKNQNINFSVEIKFANVYKHYEEANKGGLVALLKTDYVVLNLYQGFHQDEDEDDWEKFLETYVNVHPDEKGELLRRARSEERKFNEQQAEKDNAGSACVGAKLEGDGADIDDEEDGSDSKNNGIHSEKDGKDFEKGSADIDGQEDGTDSRDDGADFGEDSADSGEDSTDSGEDSANLSVNHDDH